MCYNVFIPSREAFSMDNNAHYEQEIDLLQLIRILLMRWYIIVLSVILIFGLTTFYAYNMLDNEYTSKGSIIVNAEAEGLNPVSAQQLSERLVNTYSEIAVSERVIDTVINNLDLNYSPRQIRNMLSVRGLTNTSIVQFEMTTGNPEESQRILNELILVIENISNDPTFRNLEPVDILDQPKVPLSASGPNRLLYMAIGVVLGGMIGVFGVFMIEFFDKSIKGVTDIESKLGLRTLGIIPDYEMELEVDES